MTDADTRYHLVEIRICVQSQNQQLVAHSARNGVNLRPYNGQTRANGLSLCFCFSAVIDGD